MSSSDLTGFGSDQQRRHWRELDRDDVFHLQAALIAGFGMAVFVVASQVYFFFSQREIDSVLDATSRLWGLGGLAAGFFCSELIKSRRRIVALEKRLAEANGGMAQ